jgi:hypothetical protein
MAALFRSVPLPSGNDTKITVRDRVGDEGPSPERFRFEPSLRGWSAAVRGHVA